MGGSISAPVDIKTPTVLNFILREMFRRADLVDIYSLADSQKCSRYVVSGADALESLFVKIRIRPMKGDKGVLYFQSIDGLLKGMPKEVKEKQRENCLELSFFFIRIFQIFGAVALSMFDNSIPITDPTYTSPEAAKRETSVFLQQKNFDPKFGTPKKSGIASFFGFGGSLRGGSLNGGSLSPNDKTFYIPDGSYKILNYHLYKPEGGTSSPGPMKVEGYEIYLDQASLYTISQQQGQITGRVVQSNPSPLLKYAYSRDGTQYTLGATLKIQGIDELKVSMKSYTKDGSPTSTSTLEETMRPFAGDKPSSLGQAYPQTKGKTLPSVLQAMFEDAAVQIFGAAPFSTIKFLRKINAVSGPVESDLTLAGTNVVIPASQENSESPRIIFRSPANLGSDSKKVNVRIYANLQIEEPIQDVSTGSYSYRVYLDFSKAVVEPPEVRDYVRLKSYRTTNFVAYSKTGIPRSESTDLTIPAYVEGVFQELIKTGKDDEDTIKYTRDGLVKPYDSESIPPDLRVKDLWKALAKDPPIKSHCIARAVQLLSVDAIRGTMSAPAFTSACSLSFAYQKDGSLPSPGQKLSDVYGMHALATLFWTNFEKGMPRMHDEPKYKGFLKFMRMKLDNYPSLEETPQPDKMSDVSEKEPPICDQRQGLRLQLPPALAANLRKVVLNLQAQQMAHITEGMKIMDMLFDMNSITQQKVFAINPMILQNGMPEINRIAEIARNLLMKYYSGCESTYRDGLKMIYNVDKTAPLGGLKDDGSVFVPIRTTTVPPTIPTAPAENVPLST
jgi:hypothetical protein